MKKFLFFVLLIILSITLIGCGSTEAETKTTQENTVENGEPVDTEEENTNNSDSPQVGEVVKSEVGKSTLVSISDDVDTFDSGPIKLTIEKANGVSLDVSKDYIDMYETDQLEYIQVDMEVENTSEDHNIFYASQAIMTTNTGEQLDSDMFFSDHIEGEYLGAVTKTGSSYYFLEDSLAKDVESITLFYSAPTDEGYDEIGEKIEIEIELNK